GALFIALGWCCTQQINLCDIQLLQPRTGDGCTGAGLVINQNNAGVSYRNVAIKPLHKFSALRPNSPRQMPLEEFLFRSYVEYIMCVNLAIFSQSKQAGIIDPIEVKLATQVINHRINFGQ